MAKITKEEFKQLIENNKKASALQKQLNKYKQELAKDKDLNRHDRRVRLAKYKQIQLELEEIRKYLDDKSVTLEYIQPSIVCRVPKHRGKWEMGVRKSKGLINRKCYKAS